MKHLVNEGRDSVLWISRPRGLELVDTNTDDATARHGEGDYARYAVLVPRVIKEHQHREVSTNIDR